MNRPAPGMIDRMVTMLLIPADLEADLTMVDLPDSETSRERLAHLQRLIGGYVEAFPLGVGDGLVLCDENGKLKGLPENRRAGEIVHEAGLMLGDKIAGDVLLCGDDDAEFGSVEQAVLRFVDRRLLTSLAEG